jgi:hypothetical protein
MPQQLAMKMNKDNLAELFEHMPKWAIGQLAYDILYVSARGETCYLIREQGRHPYREGVRRHIMKGSDLRILFRYDPDTVLSAMWFPIYPRT